MGLCASKPKEESAQPADVEKKGAAEHKETYAEAAKHGLEEGGDKPAAEAAQA